MRKISFTLFIFILSSCSGSLPVDRSLNTTSWGYKLVSAPEPVRAGEKSQRFEVRRGDCGQDEVWSDCNYDRERSEVLVRNIIYPKTDMWFSWSLFIPQDFKSGVKVKTTVGQIHQRGIVRVGENSTAGGFPSFPPLLQIDISGDCFGATYHKITRRPTSLGDEAQYECMTTLEEIRGKWTDVVVHFDSHQENGILELFVNGDSKRIVKNPMLLVPDNFYLKYGIYRSFVTKEYPNIMSTQIVYFDEVRMGRTRMDVDTQLNPALKPVD